MLFSIHLRLFFPRQKNTTYGKSFRNTQRYTASHRERNTHTKRKKNYAAIRIPMQVDEKQTFWRKQTLLRTLKLPLLRHIKRLGGFKTMAGSDCASKQRRERCACQHRIDRTLTFTPPLLLFLPLPHKDTRSFFLLLSCMMPA